MPSVPSSIGKLVTSVGEFGLLGSSPIRWVFTSGVQPSIGIFDMRPEDAKILATADPKLPVSLKLGTGKKTIEIKKLWVDGMRPGPNFAIRQVRLSDRRRFLRYAFVTS